MSAAVLEPASSSKEQETKCPICLHDFSSPKVLACFHSFCKQCLFQQQTSEDRVTCQVCHVETILTPQLGVDGLLNDYGLQNICERRLYNKCGTPTGKSTSSTSARNDGLCDSVSLSVRCLEHRSQPLSFFCLTCNLAICGQCTESDHQRGSHEIQPIDVIADQQVQRMEMMVTEAAKKQQEVLETFRFIDDAQTRLHQQAISTIHESFETLISTVHELRQSLIKDLEVKFGMKQLALAVIDKDVQKVTKKMSQMIDFTRRLLAHSSPTEIMLFKPLIDTRIESFLNYDAKSELLGMNQLDSVRPLSRDACIPYLLDLIAQSGFDISSVTDLTGADDDECHSPSNFSVPTNPFGGELCPPKGVGYINSAALDGIWNHDSSQHDIDNELPYQLYPPRSQIKRQKMIYY
uniref:RING-type E3 ubiquitin transferase n=1 Tax=Panagrolaimus sp. ES5 TaxID=591445 RepID=A0AC34FY64_9BILA